MKRFVCCMAFLLVVLPACDRAPEPDAAEPTPAPTWPMPSPPFGTGRALLNGENGSTLIDIEVAETPLQRMQGLMHRDSMPEDEGMAFMFLEGEASGGFWMKNTEIPLSIAFFDEEGNILKILDMEPCDADPCPSYDPGLSYSGALEVNQGGFERWGIEEGDHVRILHDERH